MLAKQHRLNLKDPKNRELFKTGQRFQSADLPILVYYNFYEGETQVNVAVAKKFVANASLRVALKRSLLNTFPRELLNLPGLKMIISVTRKVEKNFVLAEVENFFIQLTKKLNG